jgi:DUF971 family protein
MSKNGPSPTEIMLHKKSHTLEISFDDGSNFTLPAEYLRVYSPSAEVQGHGPGQEVLQLEKETVGIQSLEQVGNYALKINFDDGHDTGLYSWDTLYRLGSEHDVLWKQYLDRLEAGGHVRDLNRPKKSVVTPLIGD